MSEHERISVKAPASPARSLAATTGVLQRKRGFGGSGRDIEGERCGEGKKGETSRQFHTGWHSDFGSISVRAPAELNTEASLDQNSRPTYSEAGQLRARSEQVKKKEYFCPPVADTLTNISQMTGGGGTIGITKVDKSSQLICAPLKFDIDQKAGTCSFKPVQVSLSVTSKFVAPTATPLQTSDTMEVPGCGQKKVPIFGQVTQAISDLAKAGEQEHCDDLSISFARTLTPCAAEVNKLAGQKLPGKNDDECFKSLVVKLGFDPISCSDEFNDLTKKDDERDSQGFHDFDPVLISKNCNQIVTGYKPSKTNKIGDPAVAPNKFIPAASKCAKPSAASAAPTQSGSGQGSGAQPPVKKEEKPK